MFVVEQNGQYIKTIKNLGVRGVGGIHRALHAYKPDRCYVDDKLTTWTSDVNEARVWEERESNYLLDYSDLELLAPNFPNAVILEV